MEETKNIIDSMYTRLENFLKTETVIGEPLIINDSIKLVPIITASFGMGGGYSEGNKNGGGFGCKISPEAILVIKDENVEILPVKKKNSSLDKLFENVPDLLSKIQKDREKEAVNNKSK